MRLGARERRDPLHEVEDRLGRPSFLLEHGGDDLLGLGTREAAPAQEALAILKFAQQSASEPIYKLVASAMANAQVKADRDGEYLDEQDLYVANAYVDEGTTLKRFQPRAQGRAFQIKKRTSHITVVLSTPEVAEAAPAAKTKKASK